MKNQENCASFQAQFSHPKETNISQFSLSFCTYKYKIWRKFECYEKYYRTKNSVGPQEVDIFWMEVTHTLTHFTWRLLLWILNHHQLQGLAMHCIHTCKFYAVSSSDWETVIVWDCGCSAAASAGKVGDHGHVLCEQEAFLFPIL